MVISDTTVLIALASTGRLWILRNLWDSVILPEAVYFEVTRGLRGREEVSEALNSGWAKVRNVQDRRLVNLLQGDLRGRGECECIVLAGELGIDTVLIDDKKARKIAEKAGIQVVGTLGVLVLAVKEKVLSKDDALGIVQSLTESDFRLSEAVVKKAVNLIKDID